MKKSISLNIICIACLFMLFSCKDINDFLDPEVSGISEKDVFTDSRNTMLFLNNIYGGVMPVLPAGGLDGMRWPSALLEVTTENAATTLPNIYSCHLFNNGSWTALTTTFSSTEWSNNYTTIRACNLFLFHIDNVPLNAEYQFTEAIRNIRKGEAIFLKAFFYSEMLKQFGGLPIEDRVVSITDNMNNPRSTFDETVKYITNLCDMAALLLPEEHTDINYGRATKGAALALKSRILIYAASPLWNNPAKPDDSPFRGKYDPSKWEKAARATNDVIAMNKYQLHNNLKDLFTTRVNPELIFARMNPYGNYMTQISIPQKLCAAGGGGPAYYQVTYNLIKEYEILKNGKSYFIDDLDSGYDLSNPYINRDPRFYRDCLFNGARYQGKTASFGEAEPGATGALHNPVVVSPYYTHVYSIKFADLSLILGSGAGVTSQNYPYLRYAEILLNYAEAMNEAFGPEVDGLGNGKNALWAVNEVRTRAQYVNSEEYLEQTGGMPPIPAGLTKEVMREKIHHERLIEMAFEEHRFWDERRWMIDPSTLTNIQAQIPVRKANGTLEYQIRTIQNRVYERKMFRMPIPEDQLYANPELVQNPGWNLSLENAD